MREGKKIESSFNLCPDRDLLAAPGKGHPIMGVFDRRSGCLDEYIYRTSNVCTTQIYEQSAYKILLSYGYWGKRRIAGGR
jgi:hypothetical protein